PQHDHFGEWSSRSLGFQSPTNALNRQAPLERFVEALHHCRERFRHCLAYGSTDGRGEDLAEESGLTTGHDSNGARDSGLDRDRKLLFARLRRFYYRFRKDFAHRVRIDVSPRLEPVDSSPVRTKKDTT